MIIDTYPITMTLEEAKIKAQKQGTPLARLVLKKGAEYELKLLYVEYKIIEYQLTFRPSRITKLINKILRKESFDSKTKIRVIGNGSTGGVAIVTDMPAIIKKEVNKEEIQYSLYKDDHMIEKGKRAATKLVKRQTGGFPEMSLIKIYSVFRPFYIAYYGELIEGNKIRYLPIPADGCNNQRTF